MTRRAYTGVCTLQFSWRYLSIHHFHLIALFFCLISNSIFYCWISFFSSQLQTLESFTTFCNRAHSSSPSSHHDIFTATSFPKIRTLLNFIIFRIQPQTNSTISLPSAQYFFQYSSIASATVTSYSCHIFFASLL